MKQFPFELSYYPTGRVETKLQDRISRCSEVQNHQSDDNKRSENVREEKPYSNQLSHPLFDLGALEVTLYHFSLSSVCVHKCCFESGPDVAPQAT